MADEDPTGIVWLASYPKSGNTWTRSFLNNLHAVMEHGLDVEPQDINKLQRLTAWDIGAKQYEAVMGKPMAEANVSEIDAARQKVQAEVVKQNSGILLVKTHNALAVTSGHPTINMSVTAGAVYIVRNPLDIAISFANHIGKSIDAAIRIMSTPNFRPPYSQKSAGEFYGSWSENVASWTKARNDALLVLRYEDMHADPVKTFGSLARHLQQHGTRAQLDRAIELSAFKVLKELEKTHGFKEKPNSLETFFRSGRTGEWKEVLNDKQILTIRTLHGEQMEKFGY